MSSYISNEWLRTVHNETSHHVALVDQPPKARPSKYKDFLPILYDRTEIKTYLELLLLLLGDFKDKWRTPPSATSMIKRYSGQYDDERQILASVWTLVDIIDALETEEEIKPDFHRSTSDGTYLVALSELLTRDRSIYAHEKRARFIPVWIFVAGQPFPEPPPKFKLPGAGARAKGKQVVDAAVERQTQSSAVAHEATSARDSRDVFDDPFGSLGSGIERLTLGDCEASKYDQAMIAWCNTLDDSFKSCSLEKLTLNDGEASTDTIQDTQEETGERTPTLDSDPIYSVWDSVRRCRWSFESAGFGKTNALVQCSESDPLDESSLKEGIVCSNVDVGDRPRQITLDVVQSPFKVYAAPKRPIMTFITTPKTPIGTRPIADLASVSSEGGNYGLGSKEST